MNSFEFLDVILFIGISPGLFLAGTGESTKEDENLLEASFNNPNGITFDKHSQTLFISEFDSPNIRKIRLY